ncbi:AraC family transcriptional regulator [Dysgonomonas sp. 25]|uniref:helix-turn-helix domain-containing protein n=1 Tax=Dysgonomonas sp. 25 TaxID=2302933 RepID=UPI0021058BC4|nr:AraC family transcriptional regulator [Dysgonomonas sp. 25]
MNSMGEKEEKLYIKNMVCNRCIMAVDSLLRNMEIEPVSVGLGEVVLSEKLDKEQKETLRNALEAIGFELIEDKKIRIIEHIKKIIIELVHYSDGDGLKVNLSEHIAQKLSHDYSYLSKLFSEVTNTTIEKYFIAQKIERVKELLVYDELSLKEIADRLNYSSVAHLSAQFKTVTGLTPSHFKKVKDNKRKPLDEV